MLIIHQDVYQDEAQIGPPRGHQRQQGRRRLACRCSAKVLPRCPGNPGDVGSARPWLHGYTALLVPTLPQNWCTAVPSARLAAAKAPSPVSPEPWFSSGRRAMAKTDDGIFARSPLHLARPSTQCTPSVSYDLSRASRSGPAGQHFSDQPSPVASRQVQSTCLEVGMIKFSQCPQGSRNFSMTSIIFQHLIM